MKLGKEESEKVPKAGVLSLNFFDSVKEEINALAQEPEFIDVEVILDTGATAHAADRVDLPCHVIEVSAQQCLAYAALLVVLSL